MQKVVLTSRNHNPVGKVWVNELKIQYNILNTPTEEQTKCNGFSNVETTVRGVAI